MNCFVALSVALMTMISYPTKNYLTYTVQGDVKVSSRSQTAKLSPGDKIDEKTILTIGENGKIVLLCEEDRSLITLKSKGTATVASMVDRNENKRSTVSADYMAFIKNKIISKGNVKAVNYMQSAGTSYRGHTARYAALPPADKGHLLDPLRNACGLAIYSFETNDRDGLERAAQRLQSLGICRYNFDLLSKYVPCSFNGQFVLDVLCLRDMALSLDSTQPFSSQLSKLPMPIAATTNNVDAWGNILANYYYLDAGGRLEIQIECVGYCEIAVLSPNKSLQTTFNGSKTNYAMFNDVAVATVVITNQSGQPASLLFAINAE